MNGGSEDLNGCTWSVKARRVLDGGVQSRMSGGGEIELQLFSSFMPIQMHNDRSREVLNWRSPAHALLYPFD
jgi:hypothetical protein